MSQWYTRTRRGHRRETLKLHRLSLARVSWRRKAPKHMPTITKWSGKAKISSHSRPQLAKPFQLKPLTLHSIRTWDRLQVPHLPKCKQLLPRISPVPSFSHRTIHLSSTRRLYPYPHTTISTSTRITSSQRSPSQALSLIPPRLLPHRSSLLATWVVNANQESLQYISEYNYSI